MIIIYNLSGLIIGLAGLVVGFLVFGLTGWLSAGLLILGVIWLAFGRGRRDPESGLKRPAPSLFFIPLFVLAFPILLLALPTVIFDVQSGRKALDPRSAQFREDERALSQSKLAGDRALALAAYDVLKTSALDDKTHVFASTDGDRVLILAKIPSLKELDESARAVMVKALTTALETHDAVKGRRLFLGVKGQFTYGVVQTPAGSKIGKTVSSDPLLDYYGPPAPARANPGA
jgi:hypothetical protein